MKRAVLSFLALCVLAVPALAAPPRALTADEHGALRCAAAFAMVSAAQARGDAEARKFPPLAQRGREFFVRLGAQLMDAAGLDEAGVKAAAQAEASDLRRSGGPQLAMPFCLRVLDAQPGLANPAP